MLRIVSFTTSPQSLLPGLVCRPRDSASGDSAYSLNQNAFDLIFLDMEMPEISGTEVCDRLRKTDVNRTSPVVFVAPNVELETRARSAKAGGNDLIAKPFLLLELALKKPWRTLSSVPRRLSSRPCGWKQRPGQFRSYIIFP